MSKTGKTHKKRRVEWIQQLKKATGCSICGYHKCFRALHFHHRDPDSKSFSISDQMHRVSWIRLEEELAKCDILCANCHAEEECRRG